MLSGQRGLFLSLLHVLLQRMLSCATSMAIERVRLISPAFAVLSAWTQGFGRSDERETVGRRAGNVYTQHVRLRRSSVD